MVQMKPDRVRIVQSFDELIATPFSGAVNALCWQRDIAGDFQEILDQLPAGSGVTQIDGDCLHALALGPAGSTARDVLLADQAMLRHHGLSPSLDCISGYPQDDDRGPVPTDVYSFHVDSAPVPADTFLCTYIGNPSEGLSNEWAMRRIDMPKTRTQLLQTYGGADDEDFDAYLTDNCFDLHYWPLPYAQPYSFGLGNLWRIAIAHPSSLVLPCIHRAPVAQPGGSARLLLIS